jgi:ABC-type bacteriocin/lantibiotic exporter with double-glycine peptidase domain
MSKNRQKTGTQELLIRATSLFSARDKKIGIFIILFNVILGIMDLFGVIAIGLVGSLAVFGISSGKTNPNVESFFGFFGLSGLSFQEQAGILTVVASSLFISRTIISMVISKRILHALSRRAAVISAELLNTILKLPIYKFQKRSTNELVYILDNGISAITLGVVGSFLILISDGVLLLVMFFGLLIVNPSVAIISFISFTCIGLTLYFGTHKRAKKIGLENAEYTINSYRLIFELFDNYREVFVKNKVESYEERIFSSRKIVASSMAEQQFLPTIGKYVIESSVILLGLFVSAYQFLMYDAITAISALTIFLAAGSRFAPLVMRMQQYAIQMKSSSGLAEPALVIMDEIKKYDFSKPVQHKINVTTALEVSRFIPSISLRNVEFTYDTRLAWKLDISSLDIEAGSQIAVVGPSGGGKSTLVDIILGVLEPDKGNVLISGLTPKTLIKRWPGLIGYVPQKITAFKGSLIENVALGINAEEIDVERVKEVLELSQFYSNTESGNLLNYEVTDKGTNLSGGQLQRLGIARALYSNPKVIVLDEATSALDGQTEEAISKTINSLKGLATVILIAHRLSSVRKADQVIYIEGGNLIAKGTISEVRRLVPNFEAQAQLMGLQD